MSLSFRDVRRLSVGGLLVLSMCEQASAQLPPDSSQTRASAKECSRATPLPADTTITPAGADVPADLARFSGAWGGVWTNRSGAGGPCTTLVVEEVLANGYARVVYSIGVFDPHVRMPWYWRASGRIVDGVLSFGLPAPSRAEFTFRAGGHRPRRHLQGRHRRKCCHGRADRRRAAGRLSTQCPPSCGRRGRHAIAYSPPSCLRRGPATAPCTTTTSCRLASTAPARHALHGTLTVPALQLSSAHNGCAGLASPSPAFSIELLTHGDHLVPAVRTIIWSSDRRFGIILSPGRIWSEPGDQGLSRASFPFAIVNPIDNGTLNGLATFVFDDARVSRTLRAQITQETMAWARYDYWGQVPMTYAPGHDRRTKHGCARNSRASSG